MQAALFIQIFNRCVASLQNFDPSPDLAFVVTSQILQLYQFCCSVWKSSGWDADSFINLLTATTVFKNLCRLCPCFNNARY